jgi:hypothetical protein
MVDFRAEFNYSVEMIRAFSLALLLAATASAEEPPRSYQPVKRPELPIIRGTTRTDVDRFILAALEAKKRTLAPEADRAVLIRRVAFDLTGLPPSIAEIDAFLADESADAYENMIERYLASPRYGERWG